MTAMPKRVDTAMEYTALIRTRNSVRTMGSTMASLARQAAPPVALVVVDSGSTDGTLDQIPHGARLHRYVGEKFNYSAALNQGLQFVETDLVLVISSHTVLKNPVAMSYALSLLDSDASLGAVYFDFEGGPLRHQIINADNFDGFNGLWNTCALIRVGLLRARAFREEVFAAEDQEWAAWLICESSMTTARISGGGMDSPWNTSRITPRRLKKLVNEQAAVVHFVRGDSPLNHLRALLVTDHGSWRHNVLQSLVALRLAWLQKSTHSVEMAPRSEQP